MIWNNVIWTILNLFSLDYYSFRKDTFVYRSVCCSFFRLIFDLKMKKWLQRKLFKSFYRSIPPNIALFYLKVNVMRILNNMGFTMGGLTYHVKKFAWNHIFESKSTEILHILHISAPCWDKKSRWKNPKCIFMRFIDGFY